MSDDGRQEDGHEQETTEDAATSAGDQAAFAALLHYLHQTRGFDFGGYEEASLARRIQRRMQQVGIATYVDYLEVHPDEFPRLFDTVLVNVTGFFRDPQAWSSLIDHLPRVLDARPAGAPIRAWSAGCASGEEPYTLAMILAEHLGVDALIERVEIYATDIDDDALAQARQATYTAKAVEAVPPHVLEKYFSRSGSNFVLNKELRRAVIFGRHDIAHDAPISRVDVLTCRNTIMYFNAEAQTRILTRLHFALNDDGIILLGKAEMLLTHANLFTPVDLKLRLFARASRTPKARERWPLDAATHSFAIPIPRAARDADADARARLERAVFESSPSAIIVLRTTPWWSCAACGPTRWRASISRISTSACRWPILPHRSGRACRMKAM